MKTWISMFIIVLGFSNIKAQAVNVDKEKLLEYYENQRYADAARYLESLYPQNTQDVKALTQIAYCNMMAGKLPEAEKNYLKANTAEPNNLPILFSLANINSRRGNAVKAKAYLTQIMQLDSVNFSACKQLAAYAETPEARLSYLKKANRLNNTDPDVAYDLSMAYKELKQLQPAYDVLKIAIAADTENFTLQQAQLPVANLLGKYQEVIDTGKKLMTNNTDANIINEMGQAYFYLKDYEMCASLFKTLEDLGIQNEGTLYFMALSYRELKKYDLAAAYAKKTIEQGISKHIATYYTVLGGIYEAKNQFPEATAAYKRGLTFDNSNTINYRLGLLYDLSMKQTKNALSYYNLYLKSKPDQEKEKDQIAYAKSRIAALVSSK